MNDLVLSIDCGTSGMRGRIYDPFGNEMAVEFIKFDSYYSLQPGWCEAPGMMFWEALCSITKQLKEKHIEFFSKIIGMSVTCQRDTGTVVDEAGNPLRDFIVWKDRRLLDAPHDIPQPWRTIFNIIGKKEFVDSFNVGTHAHWIKVNEPDIWDKGKYFSFLSGHLFGKLTGRVADAKSNMAGHVPFNFKKKEWCGKNEIIAQIVRIEDEKRPPLVDSCSVLGVISAEAAEETGLPRGLPVVTSGTDKGCETIGAGCISPQQASISIGTQATVETTTDQYYELVKFFPPFPSVRPDSFNPEITVYTGCALLEWYVDTFGQYDKEYCEKNNLDLYEHLEKQMASAPVGSGGLILHPYWGIELFKPEASGSIIGFSEKHTREMVLRAIVEGIGYSLREGLEQIEGKSGVKIKEAALSGGGSNNDTICQIIANILGMPCYRVQTSSTSGLGAAVAVYKALGVYNTFEEAHDKMIHKTKVFYPEAKAKVLYNDLYNNVYKKAYSLYKPLYKALVKLKEKLK